MALKPLIGLLGTAGSGKDTAARFLVQEHDYYALSLADPIKLFCMWIFGWSAELLWGPSALRDTLDDRVPFVRCPDCGALHPRLDEFEDDLGNDANTECLVCGVSRRHSSAWQALLSPRYALQSLGTEWARRIKEDCHAEFVVRRANGVRRGGLCEDPLWDALPQEVLKARVSAYCYGQAQPHVDGLGDLVDNTTPHAVVITDCRFRNEVESILDAGGRVYRVVRDTAGETTTTGTAAHTSELEQQGIEDEELTGVIENNGTLDDLRTAIRSVA